MSADLASICMKMSRAIIGAQEAMERGNARSCLQTTHIFIYIFIIWRCTSHVVSLRFPAPKQSALCINASISGKSRASEQSASAQKGGRARGDSHCARPVYFNKNMEWALNLSSSVGRAGGWRGAHRMRRTSKIR